MKLNSIVKLMALAPIFVACDDMFEPNIENNRDFQTMLSEPTNAQGLMMVGYNRLPYTSWCNEDYATADAVSNNNDNGYQQMARGKWTSSSNPIDRWTTSRETIQYLNLFLENVESVSWAKDKAVNQMFIDHLVGETYALRALHNFYFLRAHAGVADGQMLGVPILTESESVTSDFNVSRETFQRCIEQIMADFDKSMEYLALDNENISNSEIPEKYKALGVTNASSYNRVFGENFRGRLTIRIVEALKAQVALFAASPAFADANDITWAQAADYAAAVLDRIGGVSGMASNGNTWYNNHEEIDNLASGELPKEILWRSDRGDKGTSLEENYFPPSLEGTGTLNPSQNLVDAFPMKNGYPISNASSGYKANDPYTNRDPRLDLYVIYNGADFKGAAINTTANNTKNDGLNVEANKSTKTGYYCRKMVRDDASCVSSSKNPQFHYTSRIRYTEIFLAYAESANEAWGPQGKGSHGYSAYDVIKAIRNRGGITNDSYLEEIKADKDKMRELIRNERRIELCFENTRFWDLRRWKADLNEVVKGMKITDNGGSYTYEVFDVETPSYESYMNFGPIPQSEILKWSNLVQNEGWK